MSNKKLGIFIKSNSLEFKSQDAVIAIVDVPKNIMDDMEILDPLGLEKILNTTVTSNQINVGNIVVYLSSEIIFNKIVTTSEEEKDFFDKVPIESENLIKETVTSGNQKIAIAINKKFVGNIKIILEKIGFKITSVIPEAESIQDSVDLNKTNEVLVNPTKESKKSMRILILVLTVVAITAALLFFFIKKPLTVVISPSQTPIPTTQPQSTPTSIPMVSKDTVKIQILNKTKTAGLAKKVQDTLIGFPNIEVGNIDSVETTVTNVTYSMKIGQDIRIEINNILDGLFTKVASSEGETKDGFDILIETGTPN